MEVRNNSCVKCMDPSDINTVMVDGCGRCKKGTIALGSSLRCVLEIPSSVSTMISVSNVISDRDEWKVEVSVSNHASSTILVMFLTNSEEFPCIPPISSRHCFSAFSNNSIPVLWDMNLNVSTDSVVRTTREINKQYLQFDRGRFFLSMARDNISAWAVCSGMDICTGYLGVLFIEPVSSSSPSFHFSLIKQALRFEMITAPVKSVVYGFPRQLIPLAVEFHQLLDTGQYRLLMSNNPPANHPVYIQWGYGPSNQTSVGVDGVIVGLLPSLGWTSSYVRIYSGDQQYVLHPPIPLLKKTGSSPLSLQSTKEYTRVRILYGLAMRPAPEPGDSEQLITISAVSKKPLRLVRLASTVGSTTTVYTTSKGFINDPRLVLDLVVACSGMMSMDGMVDWLESVLGLIDSDTKPFVERLCRSVSGGEVSKLYWLAPSLPVNMDRRVKVAVEVEALFL
jgi:hypothetical protein